jgi:D-amino-acid oxidase
MEIAVVGSGVIGLTTAIRLVEARLSVQVVTRDFPPDTTSSVAAAIWYPYRAYPEDKVLEWGRRSFALFEELAAKPAARRQHAGGEGAVPSASARRLVGRSSEGDPALRRR